MSGSPDKSGQAQGMGSARVIKKYPNRRLYDTEESRYITLSDVRDLVLGKIEFVVIDKKSGEDITRTILLQVISEQEQHGEPIMSEDFLSQVIRSYGKVVPAFMADYLEQSMRFFLTRQQNLRGQVKRVVGIDPIEAVADVAHKNYARWKSLQDEVLRLLTSGGRDADASRDTTPPDDKKKTG